MSEQEHHEDAPQPEAGEPSEKSTLGSMHNRIPLPLVLVWFAFFIWMAAYVIMYMIPALP